MKSRRYIAFLALTGSALAAPAGAQAAQQDVGRVLSSRPVVQTVGVPRQVCSTEPMLMETAPTGGGAVAGAVVGGLAGNSIGGGSGQAIATMLGFLAGSVVGDRIEASRPPRLFNVEHCSVQNFTETRTVGYDVEYEFAGRRYRARLANDPGPTLPLAIGPAAALPVLLDAPAPVVTAPPPGYAAPVYPAYPAYPVYAPQPYYVRPPVSIGLGLNFHSGGHWR